ncbi:MAG: hypothetical protein LUC90_11325 [Lachnospiraceae bacterium]|nr:hypothetical protein [Lachnospiraceae bacterium]
MEPTFPMIINCFIREVQKCLKETDAEKKNKLQEDIKKSVVKFGEMFEAIVNSTNGADRILLQSAPVDLGIRYASPKLCSYYSGMLNSYAKLVEDTNGGEYAFCVYPALTSSCEAHIMFHKEEQHGKVCIIQIPENRIGNIPYVRQVLFHEFFHILPSQCRLRKDRADRLNRIYAMALWPFLIRRCKNMTEEYNEHLQNMLLPLLQDKCINHYEGKASDSREFYSITVKNYYANTIAKFLVEIQRMKVDCFMNCLETDPRPRSFQDYRKWENEVKDIRSQIFVNAMNLIYTDKIQAICNFYMLLFREPLSDLLAVIALRLPPKVYYKQLIWKTNGMPQPEELSENHLLYLRASFVTEILRNGMQSDLGRSKLTTDQRQLLETWENIESYGVCPEKEATLVKFMENMQVVSSEEERIFLSEVLKSVQKTGYADGSSEGSVGCGEIAIGDSNSSSVDSDTGTGNIRGGKKALPLHQDIRDEYKAYFRECCKLFFAYEQQKTTEQEKIEKFQRFREAYCLDQTEEADLVRYVGLRSWDLR